MAGECSGALPPEDLGDHSYFAYVEVDGISELYESFAAEDVEFR